MVAHCIHWVEDKGDGGGIREPRDQRCEWRVSGCSGSEMFPVVTLVNDITYGNIGTPVTLSLWLYGRSTLYNYGIGIYSVLSV